MHVFPAIPPRAVEHLIGGRCAIFIGDQDVDQRQFCAVILGLRARGRGIGQRHHGLTLIRRIAAGDEGVERVEIRRIRRGIGAHRIGLGHRAGRHRARMDVVGGDFLDRRFLGDIVEAQDAACAIRRELVIGLFLVLGTRGDLGGLGLVVAGPGQIAVGCTLKLDMVPRLVGQGQGQGLAAVDIDVPVGQREIVVAAGQTRAVIDAGPGRLGDAVGRLVHELLDVLGVGKLDLADRGHRRRQLDRRVTRPVPAVAQVPFGQACRVGEIPGRLGRHVGRLILGQSGDLSVVERVVVDAHLVVVRTAHEVIAAHHLVRADGAAGGAELIEAGVKHGDLVLVRHLLAVDIELDALCLVPGDGDVRPGIGLGQLIQLE